MAKHGSIIECHRGKATCFLMCSGAGMENAEVMGGIPQMCSSDAATFFSCIIEGII